MRQQGLRSECVPSIIIMNYTLTNRSTMLYRNICAGVDYIVIVFCRAVLTLGGVKMGASPVPTAYVSRNLSSLAPMLITVS